jgi:hypothetical protein
MQVSLDRHWDEDFGDGYGPLGRGNLRCAGTVINSLY